MGFETVSLTDVGLERSHNEDSVYNGPVGDTRRENSTYSGTVSDVALIAVADGMGGHRAGDVASEEALDAFVEYLETSKWEATEAGRREVLAAAARAANAHLQELVEENPELEGMGTTLVGALLAEGEATLVNVGDSRGYQLVDGDIEQVTTDQSLVQQLVEQGTIDPEEADDHPQKNVLSQALGTDEEVDPDTYHLSVEGVVLLCSDGLSDEASGYEIHSGVASATSLVAASENLVELANELDGSDNVGVALAREV
jgi:serine/threonine protein phosphatase PrpC